MIREFFKTKQNRIMHISQCDWVTGETNNMLDHAVVELLCKQHNMEIIKYSAVAEDETTCLENCSWRITISKKMDRYSAVINRYGSEDRVYTGGAGLKDFVRNLKGEIKKLNIVGVPS